MSNRGTGEGFLQKFFVLYVIVWSISPPLEIDMIYRLAALGCVGLWGLVSLTRGLYIERIHAYAVFFAIAVAGIAYIQFGNFDAIMQQIAIYILIVCFVINCFYENRWEELRIVIPVVLILLIIFNWKTGTILIEDPTIARKLVRADEETYQYLRQGIGGYSLIYPQVCVFPAILAWTRKARHYNIKYFLLGCAWLVSYVRCISNAGYSIAIFVTIASAIILFFFKGRKVGKPIAAAVIIFVVGLLMILYVDGFREFLLNTFQGTAVEKKILDLVASAEEGATEGSIYVRVNAYKGSLGLIFRYPIIGGLWKESGSGHSAILDMFGKYGIWGGYLYTRMLFHVPAYYKSKNDHRAIYSVSNAVIVSILFVAVLDSFTYSFMPMIMLVLPLFYEDIIRWENVNS